MPPRSTGFEACVLGAFQIFERLLDALFVGLELLLDGF